MFKEEITSYCKNCFELEQQLDQNKDRLKAKERECEELKDLADHNGRVCNERLDKIDELEHDINELNGQLDQLKAELTRANCQIADDEILQCDMREAIEELKAENEELKRQHQGDKGLITSTGKMNYQLLQEYDKLKQILTEIKEIAEETINSSDCYERMYGGMCARPILQKISESERNND